ncbi:hypothetical protein P9112_007816 [Eukaryota sp. TZLM1-RC]
MSPVTECHICKHNFNQTSCKPVICCIEGHGLCLTCYRKCEKCPICRSPKLPAPILNRELMTILQEGSTEECKKDKQEGPSGLVIDRENPISDSPIAQVYRCTIEEASKVLKVLTYGEDKYSRWDWYEEHIVKRTRHHPNILQHFGHIPLDREKDTIALILEEGDESLSSKTPMLLNEYSFQIVENIAYALLYMKEFNVYHGYVFSLLTVEIFVTKTCY